MATNNGGITTNGNHGGAAPPGSAIAPNPFAASGLFVKTADTWKPLKISFEGFAGCGKTYTMLDVALGMWEAEGRTSIVVLQDTEETAKFVIPHVRKRGLVEGQNFFVTSSRSLLDFGKILELAEANRAIFMIDTVTHLYEEMLRVFAAQKGRPVTYPQDAMILKPMWKEKFSTPFVKAKNCHILFTGRAAWEYTMERNEETGKKEFNATGVKMRGDNETAFEPDILVLMEREQEITPEGILTHHYATIMKDRSTLIHGKQFKNPSWKDFEPVYQFLTSGDQDRAAPPVETPMGPMFKSGNAEEYWARRRQVEILIEEIEGIYNQWMPGTGGLEKQLRSIIFNLQFSTRSKTALAELDPRDLRAGKEVVEHLAMFVAKHYDAIEKDYKAGNYEQINGYLAEEREKFLAPAVAAEKARAEDDIPDFAVPKPQPLLDPLGEVVPFPPSAAPLCLDDLILAMTADNTADLERWVAELAAPIAALEPKDRKKLENAVNARKRAFKDAATECRAVEGRVA